VTFNDPKTNPISIKELINQKNLKELDEYDKIVVVAGKAYTKMVKNVFKGKKVENPLEGCKGIGFMMGRLNELMKT